MSDSEPVVSLPDAAPERLVAAVEAALMANTDVVARLREGAEVSAQQEWSDAAMARRFQTMLEIGYLVASADGFADAERVALAQLLEKVTSAAIDHEALELHFRDLDDAVAALGRRERLARAAADLDDTATAEEAISLVAMISMADGVLSAQEHAVLLELGEHVEVTPERIGTLVHEAADKVKGGLG